MSANIIDHPIRTYAQHPAVWAIGNLLITLYGILFNGWNLQPIIYIFWIEVILSLLAMLIRVATALDSRPFWDTLVGRIGAFLFGSVMGVAMIMLAVAFTFNVFNDDFNAAGFEGIQAKVYLLAFNYLFALVTQYFLTKRYQTANAGSELAATLVRLLILLVFIMVITQHLAPRFAGPYQALWTGIAVLGLKLLVDLKKGSA